jgi:hypothetical protein
MTRSLESSWATSPALARTATTRPLAKVSQRLTSAGNTEVWTTSQIATAANVQDRSDQPGPTLLTLAPHLWEA